MLEFDEFMKIEGCETKDRHMFVGSGKTKGAKAGGVELLETVRWVNTASSSVGYLIEYYADGEYITRHDFYQTPTTVIASFFLKKIDKEKASVEFATNELSLDLTTTDSPPKRYKKVIPLFGPIDTAASKFKIMGTKLEVTFVKADGSAWPVLRSDEQRTGEIFQIGRAGALK